MPSITIVSSVETFLQWAAPRFRPTTINLYRHYLYRFRDTCNKTNVDDLTRLDVETLSVKKHPLEIVRRWLKWCVDVAQVLLNRRHRSEAEAWTYQPRRSSVEWPRKSARRRAFVP